MTTANDTRISNIQSALLRMSVGCTSVVFGVAVTRWAKDGFEVGTWGRGDVVGSETAAESIASR